MLPAPDLRNLPLFSDLSDEGLEYLQSRLVYREAPSSALILHRGVSADLLVLIAAGRVTLEIEGDLPSHLSDGEIFGEDMLRDGLPSPYAARADGPVGVWLLARSDWLAAHSSTYLPARSKIASKSIPSDPHPGGPAVPPHPRKRRASRPGWGCLTVLLAGLFLCALVLGPAPVTIGGSTLAMRLLENGHPRLSSGVLSLALFLQPDSAMLHDSSGYVAYLRGDLPAAQDHLKRAVELDPGLAPARYNLGTLLLEAGDAAGAIENFAAVTSLDPGNALAFLSLGDAYLLAGDRRQAEAAYGRAWSLDPSLLEARARWAALILDEGRVDEARHAWQGILTRQPGHADSRLGLGAITLLDGDAAGALVHLQAARLANPSDPLVCLYLGLSYQALGQTRRAAAELQSALSLSRDPALLEMAGRRLAELQPNLAAPGAAQGGGQAVP